MPDADDIADTIAQAGSDGIQSVTVDGQNTVAKSVDELIKAANYTAGKSAATGNPLFGMRMLNTVPPGAG